MQGDDRAGLYLGRKAKPLQGREAARPAKRLGARVATEDQGGGLEAGKDLQDKAGMAGVKAVERVEDDDAGQIPAGMGRKLPGDRVELGGLGVAVLPWQ